MPNTDKKKDREPRLKPATKAFIDLLDKPLQPGEKPLTQTDAYLKTHQTHNYDSAATTASKLLRKPQVVIYRKKHLTLAKQTIVEVTENARRNKDKPAWQRLALDGANSILDRQLGKATTRVESTNQNLNLNVEASQELSDAFTDFLKGYTAPD